MTRPERTRRITWLGRKHGYYHHAYDFTNDFTYDKTDRSLAAICGDVVAADINLSVGNGIKQCPRCLDRLVDDSNTLAGHTSGPAPNPATSTDQYPGLALIEQEYANLTMGIG